MTFNQRGSKSKDDSIESTTTTKTARKSKRSSSVLDTHNVDIKHRDLYYSTQQISDIMNVQQADELFELVTSHVDKWKLQIEDPTTDNYSRLILQSLVKQFTSSFIRRIITVAPTSLSELSEIENIGSKVAKHIGQDFVDVIKNYLDSKGIVKPKTNNNNQQHRQLHDINQYAFTNQQQRQTTLQPAFQSASSYSSNNQQQQQRKKPKTSNNNNTGISIEWNLNAPIHPRRNVTSNDNNTHQVTEIDDNETGADNSNTIGMCNIIHYSGLIN